MLRAQRLLTAGGLFGAVAASACCLVPLTLFSVGISGAWIGNLTQLAPYKPYSIAAAAVFIGGGYWLSYRSRRAGCAEGTVCARPLPRRFVNIGLAAATILVIGAVAFDFLAPFFL